MPVPDYWDYCYSVMQLSAFYFITVLLFHLKPVCTLPSILSLFSCKVKFLLKELYNLGVSLLESAACSNHSMYSFFPAAFFALSANLLLNLKALHICKTSPSCLTAITILWSSCSSFVQAFFATEFSI